MKRLLALFRVDEDTGKGLEPLLHEFAYDVSNLSDEEKKSRIAKITGYYKKIYNSKGSNLYRAYGQTREWAKKIFVEPYVKKAIDQAKGEDV